MKTNSGKGKGNVVTRDLPDFCGMQGVGRVRRNKGNEISIKKPTSTFFQEGVRAETKRNLPLNNQIDVPRTRNQPVQLSALIGRRAHPLYKGKETVVEDRVPKTWKSHQD